MEGREARDSLYIYNYSITNNSTANSIWFNSAETLNYLYLYNYSSLGNYRANDLTLNARNNNNKVELVNHKINTSNNANSLSFSHERYNANEYINFMYLKNYHIDNNVEANEIIMSSGQEFQRNYLELANYKYDNGNGYSNRITMTSKPQEATVEVYNYLYSDTGILRANFLILESKTSGNTTTLYNYGSNESVANYIQMKSNTPILTIYSQSDIFLNSGGAVRLTSAGNQDITLTSADDIYLVWGDKLRMNGKNVFLASDGYVKWDNQ